MKRFHITVVIFVCTRGKQKPRSLAKGRDIIDLSEFRSIVSLKFKKTDPDMRVKIYLE